VKTSHPASRKLCVQCDQSPKVVGEIGRTGLCSECAIGNLVAQHLGLNHLHMTTYDINRRILAVYTGAVVRAA
jgi:hypothetical protein